jgi:hypothetical protein
VESTAPRTEAEEEMTVPRQIGGKRVLNSGVRSLLYVKSTQGQQAVEGPNSLSGVHELFSSLLHLPNVVIRSL